MILLYDYFLNYNAVVQILSIDKIILFCVSAKRAAFFLCKAGFFETLSK